MIIIFINSTKINQIKSNRKTNLISSYQFKSAANYSGANKTVENLDECYDIVLWSYQRTWNTAIVQSRKTCFIHEIAKVWVSYSTVEWVQL